MEIQEAIKRITEAEEIYDRASAAVAAAADHPGRLLALQPEIAKLSDYYAGPEWKADFELDERGKLPADLNRGVLSEDGIYNLLESNSELLEMLNADNKLETERLRMRHWNEEDAEECYKYAKDPAVGPVAGWQPHVSVENSRQIIKDVLSGPETYAIIWKETGLPIGSISLMFNSDLAKKDDECELGYWIGAPYWGCGIMTEAGREMLRRAFEDLKLERVWCGYYDGNKRSERVQEKLGFRYRWTTEDLPVPQMNETRTGHVNLITKEEWQEACTRTC